MTEKYRYDVQNDCIVDGQLDFALDNMKHLLTDVDVKDTHYSRAEELDKSGYFGFVVWRKQHAFSILMPGSPLEYVRDLNSYPRMETRPIEIGIYDGESWYFWSSIVGTLQDEMHGKGYNPYIEELEFEIEKLKKEIENLKQPSTNIVYLNNNSSDFNERVDVEAWLQITGEDNLLPADIVEANELSLDEIFAMTVEDWRDYWYDSLHLIHTTKDVIESLRWTTVNRKNKVAILHQLHQIVSRLDVVNQPKEELLKQFSDLLMIEWMQVTKEEKELLISHNIKVSDSLK